MLDLTHLMLLLVYLEDRMESGGHFLLTKT